jgi:hypothetical protein
MSDRTIPLLDEHFVSRENYIDFRTHYVMCFTYKERRLYDGHVYSYVRLCVLFVRVFQFKNLIHLDEM